MSGETTQRSGFDMKSAQLPVVAFALRSTDTAQLASEFAERFGSDSTFFDNDPVLIDLALLRDLAIAYSRAGDTGKASLATAERYALAGKFKDAEIHAERAAAQLPVGSPGWERAQDVIREAESKTRR